MATILTSPPRTRASKKIVSDPNIQMVMIQDTTWKTQDEIQSTLYIISSSYDCKMHAYRVSYKRTLVMIRPIMYLNVKAKRTGAGVTANRCMSVDTTSPTASRTRVCLLLGFITAEVEGGIYSDLLLLQQQVLVCYKSVSCHAKG